MEKVIEKVDAGEEVCEGTPVMWWQIIGIILTIIIVRGIVWTYSSIYSSGYVDGEENMVSMYPVRCLQHSYVSWTGWACMDKYYNPISVNTGTSTVDKN